MTTTRCNLLVGILGVTLSSQALALPTLTFDFAYAGSTTATLNAGQVTSGLGIVPNTNLAQINYADPAYQNPSWHHYFDLTVEFHADAPGQAVRGIAGGVSLTSNLKAITPGGVSDLTSKKYFPFNPMVDTVQAPTFTDVGDAGIYSGDLFALLAIQNQAEVALATQVGVGGGDPVTGGGVTSLSFPAPTAIGRFAIQFDQPLTQTATISAVPIGGSWFSYFRNQNPAAPNNNSYLTLNLPFASNGIDIDPAYQPYFKSFTIVAAPEPATLLALFPAAIGFAFRRRR